MHISDIHMALKSGKLWIFKYTYATATVTVVAAEGDPVEGVRVSGQWSGATNDRDSGTTDPSGKVTLASNRVQNAQKGTTFTFTVNDVTKSGWTYDRAANEEAGAARGTTVTFTDDDVTKGGWTYNSTANVKTSDSITEKPSSLESTLSSILLLLKQIVSKLISV